MVLESSVVWNWNVFVKVKKLTNPDVIILRIQTPP